MPDSRDLEAIFHEARRLPGEARASFLSQACRGQQDLRAEVEALLAADAGAGEFLESVSATNTTIPDGRAAGARRTRALEAAGQIIGRFKLLQQIGEGGFGSVWMAEQHEPVVRKVALKIIKLGMDTRQVIARFEAERQALALMDHPNIAKVLDAGATDTGRPYFVMELCTGDSITEYCDRNNLSIRERLELFAQVCQAVQHAHQKGLIHRDIKPSNILVATQDGRPHAKVIDFGIAKATLTRLTEKTLFTEHKQLIGTPQYMSPEQAEGSLDIDTRTDVYSLGVLLYELLTGVTPFDPKKLRSAAYGELQRIIREVEPPKPSTRLSQNSGTLARIAARRHTEPRHLSRIIRGDLDWITLKAMEKDRARRYETANGLALDIRRHLDGEPVFAAPPSAVYRFRKFVRRNRGPVIAGSAVVMTLLTGIVGTTIGFIHARRNAAQAREASAVALREKTAAQHQAYSANMLGASDALEREEIDVARHYLAHAPAELRGWEWRHLSSRLDADLRAHHQQGELLQVHAAPDGRSYYGVGPDPARTVRRWELETGQLLETIRTDRPCWRSWLVADGTQLVMDLSAEYLGAGTVEVWDLARRARVSAWPVPGVFDVSADGALAGYVAQGNAYLLDLRSGAVRALPADSVGLRSSLLAFHPDGRRMAAEWSLGQIRLLDVDSLQVLYTLEVHDNMLFALAFSPDGTRLASASADGTVRITDVAADPPVTVATLRGHRGWVLDVTFSPDGTLLASRGQDRTVRIWNMRTGSASAVFQTTGEQERPTAFLPDGRTLLCADDNGMVHFWDVRSDEARVLRGHHSYVYPVLLSPDGVTIYSGGWDGFVGQPGYLRIWDAVSGDPIAAAGRAGTHCLDAALSPDGSMLALSLVVNPGKSRRIDVIETTTGATITSFAEPAGESPHAGICSVVFAPDGRRLAWIDGRGVVISDARTGATLRSRPVQSEKSVYWPSRLAWSPDGATVATCHGVVGKLCLWDGDELDPIREWPLGHDGGPCFVAFSPDGGRLVTAAENGIARIWDAATGTLVHELIGRGNRLLCAAYSPDGRRIATAGSDNYVSLWDACTFEPVGRLHGHQEYVYSLAWRADSQQLVSGSGDSTVRIWDTRTRAEQVATARERSESLPGIEARVARVLAGAQEAPAALEAFIASPQLTARERELARQAAVRFAFGGLPAYYRAPHAAAPIVIDGRDDEAAWVAAAWSELFVDIEGDDRPKPRFETRMRMLWDETNLYILARLEEPHVWATLLNHDDIVLNDNDFEVFIDPDGDARNYYELEFNAHNTLFDLLLVRTYRDGGPAKHEWNLAGVRSAVHVEGTLNDPSDVDRRWTIELALPWSSLAEHANRPSPPQHGDVWRINFSRVQWQHDVIDGRYVKRPGTKEDNWVWTPQRVIDMHVPREWGFVEFLGQP